MKRNETEFAVLPAYHGDCILIKTFDNDNNEFVILVDGGTSQTFRYFLKSELEKLQKIDLLVLTHVDSDHIAGLISFFKSSLIDSILIDEIWMNHPEIVDVDDDELISKKQGNTLLDLIRRKKPDAMLKEISTDDGLLVRNEIKFTVLSPTPDIKKELFRQWKSSELPKEENLQVNISSQKNSYTESLESLNRIPFAPESNWKSDIYNSSSISFLLESKDVSLLLLADARAEVIEKSMRDRGICEEEPLNVDFLKISHHGSSNNTSQNLLSIVKTKNYLISTNGGNADHVHPSRETIARIVYSSSQSEEEEITIFFNHSIEQLKERVGDFINEDDLLKGTWNIKHQNWFKKNI